ncbi:MAG: FtsX-like permease family protein [Luteitalea sp.]|nr:FtsX-like permease family protein [Luteitalea sp.]
MSWLWRLTRILERWFDRLRVEEELNDEVQAYFDIQVERGMARGLTREEAQRAVRLRLGGSEQVKEKVRDGWRGIALEMFGRDLRAGLRMMWRSPGFTVAALLSLTLGIGATTAVFSVLHALLLAPLPFRAPENLIHISQSRPKAPPGYTDGTSLAELAVWKDQSVTFEELTAWEWTRHHLRADNVPTYVFGLAVADNFFSLLGVRAALGRTLADDDVRLRRRVVVISHRLWTGRFGADPRIVGKTVLLDDQLYEIVGVMPSDFRYPADASQVPGLVSEMWEPMAAPDAPGHRVTVLGRLGAGATVAQARSELTGLMSQPNQTDAGTSPGARPLLARVVDRVTRHLRPAVMLLVGAVVLVLMIACANVANLLLVRSTIRLRETAVRLSLGASRTRVLLQSLSENLVLAVSGSIAGLVGTYWALHAIIPFFPHNIPRIEDIGINGTVLFAALAISVGVALLLAVVPTLALNRLELARTIQADENAPSLRPGSVRLTNVLVVFQVAVALVLLVGAGLTIRSLSALNRVDMGFSPDSVLTARLMPPGHRDNSWEQISRFHREVLRNVRSQRGVSSAALVMTLPLSGRSTKARISSDFIDGEQFGEANVVSADYFQVMKVGLLTGRHFSDRDRHGSDPVAIVNRRLAHQLWPSVDSVGQRLITGGMSRTVVGVVDDEKHWGLDQPAEPKYYVPYDQDAGSANQGLLTFLVVRTTVDPAMLVPETRQAIWSADRTVPADDVKTMNQLVADSIAVPRFRTLLLGALALLALVVSTIGIYAVMAYHVTRRTRDIGISMALGAQPRQVLGSVLLDGLRLATTGMAIGLAVAAFLSRVLANQLFGVEPLDYWAFAGAAALILVVAASACFIPARWATRVDPLTALRHS